MRLEAEAKMSFESDQKTIQALCFAFQNMGFKATLKVIDRSHNPRIVVNIEGKEAKESWKFCDPDSYVVVRQMAELYKNLRRL